MTWRATLIAVLTAGVLSAQPVTDLWLRGYSVIPSPRNVRLAGGDIVLDATWRLEGRENDIASATLRRDLEEFHSLKLNRAGSGPVIRLTVAPGTVATGGAAEIDRQAYRLRLDDGAIEVSGNADEGLFYGVQTLLQLVKRDATGRLRLPTGTIEDWPALAWRFLHWDTKHHQDRMETLKRYLDWSARMKVNRIGFELEDKFAYPSHPVIGAPGAFTPAELQEIVNYGLQRYIQVVPVIQAPAHLGYVLKHPEFAGLRADGNNYQAAMCDPRTDDLIFSMYDDAIAATRGVDSLFVSTDEVYYPGIESACGKPYNPVNRSLQWVEFVQRAHDFLTKRGRKMLIWAEYPLLAEHASLLPPGIVDGVVGEAEYLKAEKERGIRQLAYESMQGGEYLFPGRGKLESAYQDILTGKARQGDPIGVFGAAWDDNGLHNETFWLGWSAIAQYGWSPGKTAVDQHSAEFMNLYYGPRVQGMEEIYRLMQSQAQAWEKSWSRTVSKIRGPGYGNSYGKGIGTTRYDFTLAAPELPRMPDLGRARVAPVGTAEARVRFDESERLIGLLQSNFPRADRNRYNLEVFLSIARFMQHQWRLLLELDRVDELLQGAQVAAGKQRAAQAVGLMVGAYNAVGGLNSGMERVFSELRAVWEKSQYPKGRTVDGRRFVQVLDDTKDHWAGRTADLSYMIAPERSIGLAAWRQELFKVIQAYAAEHKVPVKGLAATRLEQ